MGPSRGPDRHRLGPTHQSIRFSYQSFMVLRRGVPVGCRFAITRVGAPAHHIEQPKAAALVTAELDADRPTGIAGRDRWFESTLLQRRVRREPWRHTGGTGR